jgi:two-component system chemotaxis sensor kinase CheA
MFGEVRERSPITAATPELLAALARLAEPQSADEAAPAPVAEVMEEPVAESDSGDITDNEFEQLLDSLNAVKAQAEAPAAAPVPDGAAAASDEITDAEFESLLDQLHGKGQFAVDAVAAPAALRNRKPERGGRQLRYHRRRIRSLARSVARQGLCCRCAGVGHRFGTDASSAKRRGGGR